MLEMFCRDDHIYRTIDDKIPVDELNKITNQDIKKFITSCLAKDPKTIKITATELLKNKWLNETEDD